MLGGTHAIEWYLIFLLHEPHVKVLKNLLIDPTALGSRVSNYGSRPEMRFTR